MRKMTLQAKMIKSGHGRRQESGPYWYGYWREGTKTKVKYFGRQRPTDDRIILPDPTGPEPRPAVVPTPAIVPVQLELFAELPAEVEDTEALNRAALEQECWDALGIHRTTDTERVRKRVYNLLDSKMRTQAQKNDILASYNALCKLYGWKKKTAAK